MLIWSRLHDRWGDPPHFTSPIWGHPPPCKQALRKLPTCSWAKYRRTASASRNLELRPNGENQLLNWISLSTYSNLTPLILTNWYWSELPALNISFYIKIFVHTIFKNIVLYENDCVPKQKKEEIITRVLDLGTLTWVEGGEGGGVQRHTSHPMEIVI